MSVSIFPLCRPLFIICPYCLPYVWQAGLLPTSEALQSLPSMLVALTLNAHGLARVKAARPLEALVVIYTDKKYAKVLGGTGETHETKMSVLTTWSNNLSIVFGIPVGLFGS